MKARLERDVLRHALKTVLPAVGKANLAVLNGVRIEAGDGLTLTCSDLQLTITATVEADVTAEGSMVAPARLLAAFADKAPAGSITLELVGHEVQVTAGDASASFLALPVDEWPRTPTAEGEPITLSAEHVDLIRRVVPFAGTDQNRPILTGLYLGGDRAACTDSWRMAEATLEGADLAPTLIPAAAVLAALKGAEGEVAVTVGEHHATLAHDGTSWTTVLIEGEFPNYPQLLRDSSPFTLTFNAERLRDALGLAGVVDDGGRPTRIRRTGDKAVIWVDSQDVGHSEDVVPCDGNYDGIIGFNPGFLVSLLDAAGTDDVTIELEDSLKPAIVHAEHLVLVLMPVRVS